MLLQCMRHQYVRHCSCPIWVSITYSTSPAVQFPGLINGCTIDWYLPWPEEALTAVSSQFLDAFPIECTQEVKKSLQHMMANVHVQVTAACQVGCKGMPAGRDAAA